MIDLHTYRRLRELHLRAWERRLLRRLDRALAELRAAGGFALQSGQRAHAERIT